MDEAVSPFKCPICCIIIPKSNDLSRQRLRSSYCKYCVVWRHPDVSENTELSLTPASGGFLLGLLLNPEDRGYMFLRNIG
jgi:hypothetical protein